MHSVRTVLFFTLLSTALAQDFASDCPEPNGFFADAVQCDKYYACVDGVLSEKLCPDGMVFNDLNQRVENCDFPFQISCEGRPEMQPPQASKGCPRLNGYFPHEDANVCNKFYFCAGGTGSPITCPESLVFSLKTGTCGWPDEAGRVGCTSQNVLNFTCPKVDFEVAVAHPRYQDPLDCQYFYVCINGETPRRNGCKFGEVFNNVTKSCDQPINVPDCQNYYKEFFDDYFANLGTGGSIPTPDVLAAAIGSGFTLPDKPKKVRINPDTVVANSVQRRRRPVADAEGAAAAAEATIEGEPIVRQLPARTTEIPQSDRVPVRSRRPSLDGTRRRPLRRKQELTTTTTTTTTTQKPKQDAAYDDYYYYDDAATETASGAPEAPARGAGLAKPPPA